MAGDYENGGLYERVLPWALLALFGVVLVRTAWISDDAYITLRTVDNFVNGYGLTWNLGERVQAYTHPLWMFLLSGLYGITGEAYYSVTAISILLSLMCAYLLLFKVAGRNRGDVADEGRLLGVLALATLTSSRAFVDYSTSGLENPLTHLLLTLFLLFYLAYEGERRVLYITFLSSLVVLNRLDLALLVTPPVLYAAYVETYVAEEGGSYGRAGRTIRYLLIGAMPFILWECFSLFYYGFPFPNTAYAKLNHGYGAGEVAMRSINYFYYTISRDPLTLLIILYSTFYAFYVSRRRDLGAASLGVVLYLLYIVKIGGGFMGGRFLAAPFLVSVILLLYSASSKRTFKWRLSPAFAAIGVAAVGLITPGPTILSGADYGTTRSSSEYMGKGGVADERAFYYPSTGLLKNLTTDTMAGHEWVKRGRELRERGYMLLPSENVGFLGYFGGRDLEILDWLALTEPLLARLPALYEDNWRPGHMPRLMPLGYMEERAGRGEIADKDLRGYYRSLKHIVSGPLFSSSRIGEIWRMNMGHYDGLIDRDYYMRSYRVTAPLGELKRGGRGFNVARELTIALDGETGTAMDLEVSGNDTFILQLISGGQVSSSVVLSPEGERGEGPRQHSVPIPSVFNEGGIVLEGVRIIPKGGDGRYTVYSLTLS